ncbi:MAG: NTP transferase domain-containing protein [Holophaga sp.]|nr:NTP transferase domain-containing protein [Holophaga sp.]
MTPTLDGFLLTAGLGTRMGPLSQVLPKPAWTLRGKPLLRWGVDAMQAAGLNHLACNAHHLPERLKAAAEGAVEVCDEPLLLGSAGGLRHALGRAANPLAVWNGDALAEVPWATFMAEHQRRNAELSWLLVPHPGGPWNPVWLDHAGCLCPQGEGSQGPYHFTGAALWSSAALALLPEGPSDTKADILLRLRHHAGIVVEPFPWLDIGSPDHLIAAASQVAPDQEGRMAGCYIHPTAHPTGAFQRCVFGPGAQPPPGIHDANALWFERSGRQVRLSLDPGF